MDDYSRGGHTKYSMKAHVIFVTKYRKRILQGAIADDAKQSLHEAALRVNCRIIQMETDIDHVHILLEYSPKVSVSDIAHSLKQYSTHFVWMRHKDFLRQHYWKRRVLWSDGYFACSVGKVSQKTIELYIQHQG